MTLSIIIPIYNVEKYLEKCLQSCVNQGIDGSLYELVLVNDGSQDNSVKIAENFCEKYHNIRLISQDNQGLSAARNTGFKHANGEYVWYVDSDDWISRNSISIIIDCIKSHHPDVLHFSAAKVTEGKEEKMYDLSYLTLTGIDALKKFTYPCAPFYVFRRNFLTCNSFKFKEGIYHEDMELIPRILCMAETVVRIPDVLYYYMVQNPTSITNVPNLKRSYDYISIICNSLLSFAKDYGKDVKKQFNILISQGINNAITNAEGAERADVIRINQAFYENKHLYRCLLKTGEIKYTIEGIAFTLFPHRVVDVYRLYSRLFHN